MLNIAICDNEPHFIDTLSHLILENIGKSLNVLDKFSVTDDLLNSQQKYDLIFLDTNLSKRKGIQTALCYDRTDTLIVFTGNEDEFIYDVINSTNVFGFIRKNKMVQDFNYVIQKFLQNEQRTKFLPVKINQKVYNIRYFDIVYIEKSLNYVTIHTTTTSYSPRMSMVRLNETLSPYGFVRPHTGYIVNLDYVSSFQPNALVLHNEKIIPISRKNLRKVKNEFIKRSEFINRKKYVGF